MPIMKIGQTEQPFLRWDNPWLWIIGMIGISLLMKPAKKTTARKRNPVLRRNSPIPNEGLMMLNPSFCGGGMNPTPTKDHMFGEGNTKLGKGIWAFSLPRVTTCPGKSEWCSKHCYMKGLRSRFTAIRNKEEQNFEKSKLPNFPQLVRDQLLYLDQDRNYKMVRIHVDGDFYNNEYIRKWIDIIKSMPKGWKFYAYTKSWRVPSMMPALNELRSLPNMILRASTDESTGKPPAGWLEAGVDECQGSPKSFNCKFYDIDTKCDKCLVCVTKRVPITLTAH